MKKKRWVSLNAESKSPCASCDLHHLNIDKNIELDCLRCTDRIEYANSLDQENIAIFAKYGTMHSMYAQDQFKYEGKVLPLMRRKILTANYDDILSFAIEFCSDHGMNFYDVINMSKKHGEEAQLRRKLFYVIHKSFPDESLNQIANTLGVDGVNVSYAVRMEKARKK